MRSFMLKFKKALLVSGIIFTGCMGMVSAGQVRLKDVVEFKGARPNQLFGYGLVVGLNGTGDKTQTVFTGQSLTNMLDKLGIAPSKISKFGLSTSGSEMKVKNVAAVLVTAQLNPFIREGTRLDVVVSSIGDCNSLEGGTLILTPLQAADGKIYAVAQGAVSVGGLAANTTTANHPTVAHISGGALVEREVPSTLITEGKIELNLKYPDFTTALRIQEAILLYDLKAKAIDSGLVEVEVNDMNAIVPTLSKLEQILVEEDRPAKIVINERTGTLVTGEQVRISAVALSHGNLTVTIRGEDVTETTGTGQKVAVFKDSISIGEVARSLNLLGASPTEMISIFQAMKRVGAIKAELEMM